MDTTRGESPGARPARRSRPGLEMVVTRAVPYGPGLPGYEWVNDHLVQIHPQALDDLGARVGLGGSGEGSHGLGLVNPLIN